MYLESMSHSVIKWRRISWHYDEQRRASPDPLSGRGWRPRSQRGRPVRERGVRNQPQLWQESDHSCWPWTPPSLRPQGNGTYLTWWPINEREENSTKCETPSWIFHANFLVTKWGISFHHFWKCEENWREGSIFSRQWSNLAQNEEKR